MGLLHQLGDGIKAADRVLERAARINILTLDACIQKAYEQKKRYPQICGFLVTRRPLGMDSLDGMEIVMGYMDKNHKAITLNGTTALADIFRANTVDGKLLDLFDGNDSAIYEF